MSISAHRTTCCRGRLSAIAARLGIFSAGDAERLTSVPRRQIRGWLQGHARRKGAKAAPPVPKRQYEPIDGEPALGFLDLIEVAFLGRIVHAARPRGHAPSWRAIRTAAGTARRILRSDHPFAARRIHTDGRSIFLEAQRETGDAGLYDLTRDNFAILDMLSQSFVASVEYEADEPRAWTPDERLPRIVIDPRRAFGRPTERASGAPAEALVGGWNQASLVERAKLSVTWWESRAAAVAVAEPGCLLKCPYSSRPRPLGPF